MRVFVFSLVLILSLLAFGCGENAPFAEPKVVSVPLRDIAADRLSYKYEADVPSPPVEKMAPIAKYERDDKVQEDFDQNRPLELLERTIASPDESRIVVVYRKPGDFVSDYRLDMYSKEGVLLKKIVHEQLAVQFPDTIVWSPDGSNVAFVAKIRSDENGDALDQDALKKKEDEKPAVVDREGEDGERETDEDEKSEEAVPEDKAANPDVLTFRTEQLYIANSEGTEVKPLTRVEGLMYFYFVWSPDSSALAALAAIRTEWTFFESRANDSGQIFVPRGRPRLIEKNGRERRLDDMATAVHPVWSPDSSKIAIAYDKQVRLYDALRDRPTQAAVPLEADMRLSSQKYEESLSSENSEESNSNTESESTPTPTPTPTPDTSVPNSNRLVSFNPIVNLVWAENKILYLETGFVRNYKDETESVRSYMRWHRLILSAQPARTNVPGGSQGGN